MKYNVIKKTELLLKLLTFIIASIIPCTTFSQRQYRLGSEAQRYFQSVDNYSYTYSGSGVFSNVFSNSDIQTKLSKEFTYIYHLCIPDLWGGCFYEHDYGLEMNNTFHCDGEVNYKFNIPFGVDFQFPKSVYPNQRIYLKPLFTYSNNSSVLETSQNYNFYNESSVTVDAPFDGLDDLTLGFNQYSDRAKLNIEFPVLPLVPSLPLSMDVPIPPFNSGGGSFYSAYIKLGGTGTLVNSGTNTLQVSPNGDMSFCAVGTSQPAWKVGVEHFELVANILKSIPNPYTSAAGLALDVVRTVGQFKLDEQIDGRIWRGDALYLELCDLPSLVVPDTIHPGTTWTFTNFPVTVKYRVRAISFFNYELGYSIIFDMAYISPNEVVNQTMADQPVDDGAIPTGWQEFTTAFTISGSVPVESKNKFVGVQTPYSPAKQVLAVDGNKPLFNGTYQQPSQIVAKIPVSKDFKVAAKIKSPLIKIENGNIKFQTPIARTGKYMVILGKTSESNANTIIDSLSHIGISVYKERIPHQSTKVVTFGNFENEKQATLMKNMLNEVFNINATVSNGVGLNPNPISNETITRLQMPVGYVKKLPKTRKWNYINQ